MSAYVAITRVRRRENLLIFRPFDRKPYNEGEMPGTQKLLQVLRGESVDWDEWEAKLMPRDQCERCRRRLLVEAFTKYEFQRKERPAFCKECTAEMKGQDEKWCKTCNTWATKAEGDGCAGEGDETKKIRTLYCVKCSDVKAQQNSRTGNAKWKESVLTVRCSSKTCLALFDEQGEVSDAQKKKTMWQG